MKLKAVVRMIYDRDWRRVGRRWRPLTKTIVRNVYDLELIESAAGGTGAIQEAMTGFVDHNFLPGWEAEVDWFHYRGMVKFKKQEVPVYSWTFDIHPPLHWKGSLEPQFSADLHSVWDWIALLDWDKKREGVILRDYWKQHAYQDIRKYLGADAFDQEWELIPQMYGKRGS